MPAIAATDFGANEVSTVTETTLNGSDTLTYTAGRSKYLILRNPTGGAISPTIDGDGATSEYVPGLGTVTTSGGKAVGSIAAGAVKTINLDSITAYLKGTIAITSGTGLVAVLVNV
jgi:hypothetical protein